MANFLKLPTWADENLANCVVETPRGSSCKLDWDPKLKVFTLAKPLMAGLTYPYDWGFIPSTKAEDGDPVDVLIIHDSRTYPGVVLRCRPVCVLEVLQRSKGKEERNDRVFAVPDRPPLETDLQYIRKLPARSRNSNSSSVRRSRSKRRSLNSWAGTDRATRSRRSSSTRNDGLVPADGERTIDESWRL